MSRYTVNLYDNDNDYYLNVLSTDNKEQALQTCKAISILFYNNNVILRRNDKTWDSLENKYKDEPFDYVEVYDEEQAHTILINDIDN